MIAAATAVALLFAAAGASPDWWYVSVSGDPGEQNAHYADRASISREGDLVTVAEAREHETVDELGISSARLLVEYHCRERTTRIASAIFFGPDGSEHSRSLGDVERHRAEALSVAGALLRFACGEEEGLEQLGQLGVRQQALLLFRERTEYLRAHPEAD